MKFTLNVNFSRSDQARYFSSWPYFQFIGGEVAINCAIDDGFTRDIQRTFKGHTLTDGNALVI